jgi:hypothetical protein
MTWKKSNDGGLDYDVSQETKKEEKPFNPFATAFTETITTTFNKLPLPIQKKLKKGYGY